jgi:16S rRNA (cytosine967-C5)-methyltransferase
LAGLATAQLRMLTNASAAVAPGGRLVYATCSTEAEENQAIVDAFLRETGGFVPVDARSVHPALPAAVVDARGHLRTTPDEHGLEGFFGAVFQRTES